MSNEPLATCFASFHSLTRLHQSACPHDLRAFALVDHVPRDSVHRALRRRTHRCAHTLKPSHLSWKVLDNPRCRITLRTLNPAHSCGSERTSKSFKTVPVPLHKAHISNTEIMNGKWMRRKQVKQGIEGSSGLNFAQVCASIEAGFGKRSGTHA